MTTQHVAGTKVHDEDLALVRDWFTELAGYVRAVDFAPARKLMTEDLVIFGTIKDFVESQPEAEANQWRHVWPSIDDFVFRDDIRAFVSPDRLFAVGLAIFDSTGYDKEGGTFSRPGRATVSFVRAKVGDPFVANHTHMSLFPGTPPLSYAKKPSKS